MNIQQLVEKIKGNKEEGALLGVFLLVSLASFGLGRLSAIRAYKPQIQIERMTDVTESQKEDLSKGLEASQISLSSSFKSEGEGEKLFVASKSGTRYYFPWCSGVGRIKEENKIWFTTPEEAKKAGYSPASNCKGL